MRTYQEQIRVSAIIPTLNAAETLAQPLAALRGTAIVSEVVVVDGGSCDETVSLAQAAGARVITAMRGRGTQLAAGADAASSEWLLFHHADCCLEPGWEGAAGAFCAAPQAKG